MSMFWVAIVTRHCLWVYVVHEHVLGGNCYPPFFVGVGGA
jgi:hypothetical protein